MSSFLDLSLSRMEGEAGPDRGVGWWLQLLCRKVVLSKNQDIWAANASVSFTLSLGRGAGARGTRRECWQRKKLLVHICHFRNKDI